MDCPFEWRTRLDGNEDDLSLLAQIFKHGRCQVFRDDNGYVLAGDFLGECEDAWNVNEASERQLELMVGAALAEAGGAGLDVRCGLVEEVMPDGAIRSHLLASPLEISIGSGVRLWKEHPGLASHCIDKIQGNEHFDMAFRLWSEKSRTWPRLYRIMEDVALGLGYSRSRNGGTKTHIGEFLQENHIISKADDFKRFRYTACEARAAGRDARHAEGMSMPPSEIKKLLDPEMSHSKAVSFVGKALLQLLKRLAGSESSEL